MDMVFTPARTANIFESWSEGFRNSPKIEQRARQRDLFSQYHEYINQFDAF